MSTLSDSLTERPWDKRDLAISATLFVVTFLSRLPFRTSMLYVWDSILYARAIEHFDVLAQQPQPPGYIFYVGMLAALHSVIPDPNSAMVWVSVLASSAAVAAMFWLGRSMFSRRIGIFAALFLATSLSFWVHGEVALPYALSTFLTIVAAALIYKTWQGKSEYVIPAALFLGVASGFRQDLLIFLFPLFLVGLIGKRPARIIASGAVLVAAILSWLIPTVILTGSYSLYEAASSAQSNFLIEHASFMGEEGPRAIYINIFTLGRFFFWAASGALPLIGIFVYLLIVKWQRLKHEKKLLFLAVWSIPSLLFYIFIHIGELGYIFIFLPAALLAGVWGAQLLLSPSPGRSRRSIYLRSAALLPALLIAANLAMFLFISPKLSARSLAERDSTLSLKLGAIKEKFKPDSTLIVAIHDDEHVSYYLPEYQHLRLDSMDRINVTEALPPGIRQVVIFDSSLQSSPASPSEYIGVGSGYELEYIPRNPGQKYVTIDWDSRNVMLTPDKGL